MFFEPKYKSTYDIPDYKEYYQYLFSYNTANQKSVNLKLSELLRNIDVDGMSIYTTGSDGRFEKSPGSKIEFQIYNFGQSYSVIEEVKNKLLSVFSIDGKLDVIDFNKDVLTFYDNDKSRPFPSRILDQSFLYGFESSSSLIMSKLFSEWNDPKLVKSVIKKLKTRKSYHKKISNTGVGKFKSNTIVHFDLNSGVSYYDRENGVLSFKVGPLRFIQYTLVKDYITLYSYCKKFGSILQSMPKNLEKRLTYFDFMGLINPKINVSDLKDNYEYFIYQYNRTQDSYVSNGDVGVVEFDKLEVKERLKSLSDMLSGNSILIPDNLKSFSDFNNL